MRQNGVAKFRIWELGQHRGLHRSHDLTRLGTDHGETEDAIITSGDERLHEARSFALLLFLGFWHKRLGVLGALGSCASFIGTVTIIPFMPDGWAASAGGFPAMTGNVPFLMKDVVLFAVSVYLLRQDVARVSCSTQQSELALAGSRLQATR